MNENETFVDVGANIGSYSLRVANDNKNKGVEVVAIEAHPENFKALRRNIQINNFRNVKTINKAASDAIVMILPKLALIVCTLSCYCCWR